MTGPPATDIRRLIDERPIGATQYVQFVVLFLTLAIDGLDTQITSYLAPTIAREWHISMASLGGVLSAGLAGSATGAITFGVLGDAIGNKRAVLIATLLIATATLSMSIASSVTDLVLLRFVTGIGVGGSLPNLIALASQLAPAAKRATVVTWTGTGIPAGAAFAGLLASQLLESHGWRLTYQAAGLFPLALLPVIWFVLPESIPKLLSRTNGQQDASRLVQRMYPTLQPLGQLAWGQSNSVRLKLPIIELFRNGLATQSILLAVAFFLCLSNVYFLANWLPGLLQQANSGTRDSILATSLFNLGGIAGALILGRLIDRAGYRVTLTISLSCVVLFMALLASRHYQTSALLTAAFIGGFFVNGSQGAMNAVPALLYGDRLRATAAGWALGIGRLGFIGPLVAGVLLGAGWSYSKVLIIAALLPAMAILALQMVSRAARRVAVGSGAPPLRTDQ